MAAGKPVTKQEIDSQLGQSLYQLHSVFIGLGEIKDTLDTLTTTDLEGMGYDPGEAALVKSAVADAGQLIRVFEGAEAVTPAKDFRVFMRRLWGLGITR